MKQINHIIFLIHPCCYEPIEPEQIRGDGLQLFLAREEEVKARWLAEIAQRRPGTLYLQLGGPDDLQVAATATLGEAALSLKTPFPASEDLDEYYQGLTQEIRDYMSQHDLGFDPATVSSELWGESFEGCVPGYGGAFAQHLGLERAPQMRFEMTVYDSRFLHEARTVECLTMAGTDVEAWLFECHDGTGVVTFQPRRTAQWLDERMVKLSLSDQRHQVCDKQGYTVWPDGPWTKAREESLQEVAIPMKEWISRWVRGVGTGIDAFREVVQAAQIETAPWGPRESSRVPSLSPLQPTNQTKTRTNPFSIGRVLTMGAVGRQVVFLTQRAPGRAAGGLLQVDARHHQALFEGARLIQDIAHGVDDHRIAMGCIAASHVGRIGRGVGHDGEDQVFCGS